ALVSVADATLRYAGDGERPPAVQKLSLQIARGEFAAVVGPSGCGKSTLMKLVSGLAAPSEGAVYVGGEAVLRPIKIVGMAFQNPALLPWRTVLENLLLPIQIVRPYRYEFRCDRTTFLELATGL